MNEEKYNEICVEEAKENTAEAEKENAVTMSLKGKKKDSKFKVLAILSFLASVIFMAVGFYKMYVYDNGEITDVYTNAYVGGDAYNFIINGTYAISFFVLMATFALMGMGFLLLSEMKNGKLK